MSWVVHSFPSFVSSKQFILHKHKYNDIKWVTSAYSSDNINNNIIILMLYRNYVINFAYKIYFNTFNISKSRLHTWEKACVSQGIMHKQISLSVTWRNWTNWRWLNNETSSLEEINGTVSGVSYVLQITYYNMLLPLYSASLYR